MLYIAGISISFFLCLLLLSKPGKTLADQILAGWLFVMGLHLFFFYVYISGKIYSYPWLLGIQLPMPLFHGPFLYLYASAVTGQYYKFSLKQALHFLPVLLSYIYMSRFFLLPASEKIFIFQHKGAGYETFLTVNISAIFISGISYVILTTRLHRMHRLKIMDEFSFTEKINLDWILYLICGIALIWVFVILNMDNFVFGTAVFFVLFIGYFGIKQVGIFTLNGRPQRQDQPAIETFNHSTLQESRSENIAEPGRTIDSVQPAAEIPLQQKDYPASIIQSNFENHKGEKKKYLKSGLSESAALELHNKLSKLMKDDKLFNQSDLTLTELAKKLGTHPNYLSQVINEKEGKNFYDYINTLRTEEFIKLIADPRNQKFTLLSLAFECGFNSKSSFNKYFKKVTGYSPSEYVQRLNAVAAA